MELRSFVLKALYKAAPFELTGDMDFESEIIKYELSCVINFYGHTNLLRNILSSLADQDIEKDRFEVVLVEDRNGTSEGKALVESYSDKLNVSYHTLKCNFGTMGFSRNCAVSKTKGSHILLLDDDTVILQKDFISNLLDEFKSTNADAIMPRGFASFCTIDGKFQFHDPYFPTSRCMAYTRKVLEELKGFVSNMVGQEDVEFVVRLTAGNKIIIKSRCLEYFHPPLIVDNLNKPSAVGASFFELKNRYPFVVWFLLLINGVRWMPYWLAPFNKKALMHARFSLGFLKGIVNSIMGKKTSYN